MKKLLASLLLASFMSLNITPVLAMDTSKIKDMTSGYWANSAIECVVSDDLMSLDDNFN